MARFKSNYKLAEVEIPTSSLPDIIFMLLFFFMVTTVLKTEENKIKYLVPQAEQLRKIEKKSLVSEIKIGIPQLAGKYGEEPVIQAGGRIISLKEVIRYVEEEKNALPEYHKDRHIILLTIDREVEMGLVTDLQQELKKANARRVVYASLKEE